MKIAMVVLGGLHPSGEREVVPALLALFSELARSHEIHAFAIRHLDRAQTYLLRGFTVHDLGRPSAPLGFSRAAAERTLMRALESAGPFDLIHGFWADPAGQLAARAGKRLGIPAVVTCDGGEFVAIPGIDYGSQRTARGRRAVTEACSLATRVHVCTHFMAALAQSHGLQPAVIPLTSVYAAADAGRSPWPQGHALRLVQVASLSHVKNQRLVLDALPIVAREVKVHLDLVGEDTLDGELQRHCASLAMDGHVTFHGFLPQPQVHDLLAAADLYVQSSLHEAAGVSVLEAAAHGVAAVGTAVGYVADWSHDAAVAVKPATPESLAEGILGLARDRDRRDAIASQAQAFSLAHDVPSATAAFEKLYAGLR